MKTKRKILTNVLLYIIVLGFNYITAMGYINNLSQADVSKMYQTPITPLGYAFSIWGLIYSLLFISFIYLLSKNDNYNIEKYVDRTWILVNISALANIAWTISFSYLLMVVSTILIIILLYSLIKIVIIQKRSKINPIVKITYGMYAGWLMIATIVNIVATIVQNNLLPANSPFNFFWFFILLLFSLITYSVSVRLRNKVIYIPIIWAYIGIYFATSNKLVILNIIIFSIFISNHFRYFSNRYY